MNILNFTDQGVHLLAETSPAAEFNFQCVKRLLVTLDEGGFILKLGFLDSLRYRKSLLTPLTLWLQVDLNRVVVHVGMNIVPFPLHDIFNIDWAIIFEPANVIRNQV